MCVACVRDIHKCVGASGKCFMGRGEVGDCYMRAGASGDCYIYHVGSSGDCYTCVGCFGD